MIGAKFITFFAAVAVCYGSPTLSKSFARHLGINEGTKAHDGQFPYVASIQTCDFFGICQHTCGGVIIDENWILTASGCVVGTTKVVVGAVNLFGDSGDKQTVEIEKSFRHPDFAETGLGPNDIGLIKLKTSLILNTNVQIAKLPAQGSKPTGKATVAGYGSSILPEGNNLQYVNGLEIVSFLECNAAIKRVLPNVDSPLDRNSNLCTLNSKSNNCDGDIGGPLSQNGEIIGLVTWFINPCGDAGAPNVFTNVASFVEWIAQTINDNQ